MRTCISHKEYPLAGTDWPLGNVGKLHCSRLVMRPLALVMRPHTPLYEEGQTLTLGPGKPVQQPITYITWKYNGNLVVNWISPDRVTYYGKFKGRTTLDVETLKLEIINLTLSDGGTFSLETDKGPVNSYGVGVIKNPPKPEAFFKIESDVEKRHFKCVVDTMDTAHLGPVTYRWKMDNGDWLSGTERLDLSVAVDPQEVSCKVITRLSESEASSPTENDCHKPAPLYEEGQTLTLRKCKTVQQPITIIRWKHNGNLMVNWISPDRVTYYGKFKGRTTLDAETLKLEIKDLTLSDGGTFSLETEKGPVNSYEVGVISIFQTPYNRLIQPESGRANELSTTASDMSSKSGRQSFIFNERCRRGAAGAAAAASSATPASSATRRVEISLTLCK
ncbi:hypothetical protein N1851_015981 [Merluccius polli]|uniref:Uncharacterized protein n=1 Tax=Merluccius polli TaxID=89951 RepID=A0AA47MS72_MERPO|nr:hypothetical protein N1851_015981 [Merluccius polli]